MYDEKYLIDVAAKVISKLIELGAYCKLVKTISKKGYTSLDIMDNNNILLYNIGYEKDNPYWSNKIWSYKTISVYKIVDIIYNYIQSNEYYELVAISTK